MSEIQSAGKTGTYYADRVRNDLRDWIWPIVCISIVNGLFLRFQESIFRDGLLGAVVGTFGISIIIWVAISVTISLFHSEPIGEVTRIDVFVLMLTVALICLPVAGLSWIGLTILSVYLILNPRTENCRRASWVLFALCFSGQWSRLLFRYLLDEILKIDTFLVAVMSRTASHDNLILAADGVTTLQVLEGCSSFNNMSLAFLGWIVARSYFGTRGLVKSALFIALSCASIVLINTVRISIIALWPITYELVHGAVGGNIASMLSAISVATISILGAKR